MKKDEFYIGYRKSNSKSINQFIKRVTLLLGVIVIFIAFLWAFSQPKAPESKFELGSVIELQGTLMMAPYPMLRINHNEQVGKDILLLGFGKFGANKPLGQLSEQSLDGKQLKIKGTLIYYDGKTLFQIDPDIANSIKVLQHKGYKRISEDMGSITLEGEIIDPKCYFGVMKPGHGKIHRSCGVRCIAGGIPPVLLVSNSDGTQDYMLIVDENNEPVNQQVLEFVGKPVQIKGSLAQLGDWLILKTTPEKNIETLNKKSKVY
ncbi:hypothetical protein EMN47_09435 [Prolixibacteraceae bacterium JC049]|nr:hypothetical protein [Prolixibacteraceae bacterium JC049]